jgi:hypothetical protein
MAPYRLQADPTLAMDLKLIEEPTRRKSSTLMVDPNRIDP